MAQRTDLVVAPAAMRWAILAAYAVLAACTQPDQNPQAQPAAPRPNTQAPQVLRLAFREEPTTIHGGSAGTPEREVAELLHAGLTYFAEGEA